ncbi:MAG: type II toxin-antitoxin system RelE family toxin [Microgenomates group bacterium]
MTYQLIFTKNARDDIEKLDRLAKKRLGKKLLQFQKNPLLYARRLTSSIIGEYRFRVGDYRVVFDIKGKKIVILRIVHRREIYR